MHIEYAKQGYHVESQNIDTIISALSDNNNIHCKELLWFSKNCYKFVNIAKKIVTIPEPFQKVLVSASIHKVLTNLCQLKKVE